MIMLDYRDPRPIYEQVKVKLEEMILSGVLKQDEQLPSVRSLAMDLSINPNTIQRAYNELEQSGYIYSVRGRGSFVSDASALLPQRRAEFFVRLDQLIEDGRKIGLTIEEMKKHMAEK